MAEPPKVTQDADATHAMGAHEEALDRLQSMSSILRMTSALGHEFNNLMQTTIGALELTRKLIQAGRASETTSFIASAMRAAQSAIAINQQVANITRARTPRPQPLDLNERVTAMSDLLVRALPRSAELATKLAPDLWPTRCDMQQADVAILDLFFSALDSVEGNCAVSIRTWNRRVDGEGVLPTGLLPGRYVGVEATCAPRESMNMSAHAVASGSSAPKAAHLQHRGAQAVKRFARSNGGDATFDRDGVAITTAFFLPPSDGNGA